MNRWWLLWMRRWPVIRHVRWLILFVKIKHWQWRYKMPYHETLESHGTELDDETLSAVWSGKK